MKSRRQKILSVLAICFLCASFFILSVSAADVYRQRVSWDREWPENPSNFRVSSQALDRDDVFYFTDNTDFDLLPGPTSTNYAFDVAGNSYLTFSFRAPERSSGFFVSTYYVNNVLGQEYFDQTGNFPSSADGFYLDPGILDLFLENQDLFQYQVDISHIRFSLRYFDADNVVIGKTYAATDLVPVDLSISGSLSASDQVDFDTLIFRARSGIPTPELALCIDFVGTVSSLSQDVTLGMYYPEFFFSSSVGGIGPEVPQYTPPDFRPEDDLHELESDIIGSITPNLDVLDELNNDFGSNLQSFSLVFARISQMLTRLTGGIPFMDVLFQFSLILGFWAFAVGATGSIIGAAGRRESDAERARKSVEFSEERRYQEWLFNHRN